MSVAYFSLKLNVEYRTVATYVSSESLEQSEVRRIPGYRDMKTAAVIVYTNCPDISIPFISACHAFIETGSAQTVGLSILRYARRCSLLAAYIIQLYSSNELK